MSQIDSVQIRVQELMRAGRVALAKGDRQRAHYLWRQAATLDPQNEHIWLSLLNVVENTKDRRTCLQNIVAINPANAQARQQLQVYSKGVLDTQPAPTVSRQTNLNLPSVPAFTSVVKVVVIVLTIIALFVLGVVAGMVFNLL